MGQPALLTHPLLGSITCQKGTVPQLDLLGHVLPPVARRGQHSRGPSPTRTSGSVEKGVPRGETISTKGKERMLDAQPIITADRHPSQETCTTKPRGDSSLPFILARILSLLIVAYGRDSVLTSKVSVGLLPSIACPPVKGEFRWWSILTRAPACSPWGRKESDTIERLN